MTFIRKHKRFVSISCVLLLLLIYVSTILSRGRLEAVTDGSLYGKSTSLKTSHLKFTSSDSALTGMKEVCKTDELILYVNEETATFAVQNLADSTIWYSNPELDENTNATGDILNYLKSHLIVEYYDSSDYIKTINSYYDSIKQEGMNLVSIENGFRVEYTLGKPNYTMDMLPRVVDVDKFEQLVLDVVEDEYMLKTINKRYKKKTISKLSDASAQLILDEYPNLDVSKEYYILDLTTPDYDFKNIYNIIFNFSNYTEQDLIEDNKEIDYSFEQSEPEIIYIPLEVTLEKEKLSVRIPCKDIKAPSSLKIKNIQVLPFFAAADLNDEGYMFVPDGSGALINFNNEKITSPSYSVSVYGNDYAITTNSKTDDTPVAYLPIFGEKKNNTGFWCVIEDGEAHAQINSVISGVISDYNQIYASFSILPVDFMTVESNGKKIVTNRYQQDYYQGDIKLTYNFTVEGESDYSDFAVDYRNYLIKNGELSLNKNVKLPFIVELVGKIECVRNILGIEYDSYETMTTFSQAKIIMDEINQKGISSPIIKYSSWFSAPSQNTASRYAKVDSKLGNKKELESLKAKIKEIDGTLFFNTSVFKQYGNWKDFNYSLYGSRYIYNQPVRIENLNIATGEPDEDLRVYSLLSANYLNDYLKKLIPSMQKKVGDSIWFDDMACMLSSDFTKENTIDRQSAKNLIFEAFEQNSAKEIGLDAPYAYALKYADYVCKMPLTSSSHILIDETVPFLPIVLSGCLSYTGDEFNLYGDVQQTVLKAVETGAGFYYKWMYESNTEICELEGYEARNLYSLNYSELIDEAADYYKRVSNDLNNFIGKSIVAHEKIAENVYKTYYEDGWVVVNYNDYDYNDGIYEIGAMDYVVGG